ncbi:MAG: TolC family protein [Prevotellaceae bacterium]|jgi:cobalt-zinc-cadmium resistance protein CzcA|nr:TolC family protein [Prevotellaceae bacterium]
MKSKKIIIPTFTLLFALQISAQEVKKSLQECIEAAMQNNLTMQSGKIAIERSKALQGTAFNIDKTQLSLSQDPTSGGSPDNSFSVSQSFEFPTVYASRRSLLKAETNLEQSNLEVTRNELIRQISSIYEQLLYARENISILQEQDSIYGKFVFLATAKFKAGETSRLEQINAERLYSENIIVLQQAKKDYQNIQLALQRWLNTSDLICPAEAAMTVIEAAYPTSDFNASQTPVNQVFESKKAIGEKLLSLTKQEFLPSFNVALHNQLVLSGFNPYNVQRERFGGGNFMGFEVGVGIPLFFGEQRAKTRAAKREVEMIKTQQKDALLSLDREYRIALNDYVKAKNALDYYQTQGNRQADEISQMSQLSYEKGEIGYMEYIQNLKTAAELHLQYANAVNSYNQSVILLNYLSGNKYLYRRQ